MVYSVSILISLPILMFLVKSLPFFAKKKSKLQKKYSKTYYYRRAHYDSLTFNPSINDLFDILNHPENQTKISKEIKFRKLEWGISVRNVISTQGSPRFIKKTNYLGEPCLVLFYKEKIGKYNVIAQLHFINHNLFIGTYTLANLNLADINKIKEQLRAKYDIKDNVNSDCVQDQDGNVIKIEKNHNETQLIYLWGEPSMRKLISDLKNQEIEIKEKLDQMELSNIYEKL